MNILHPKFPVAVLCAASLAAVGVANAQSFEHPEQQVHSQPAPHPQGQPHAPAPVPQYTQPTLHSSHYYPPHGTTVSVPPPTPVVINHPSGHYYYSGGIWYAPRGPSYVVVAAPVGVFVPVLPAYYTTVWVAGAPYYYANQTYYAWSPQQNSYETVAPPDPTGIPAPEDADAQQGQPPPDQASADQAPMNQAPAPVANDGLYVYPQNGQSDQQQASDRYECHKWAGMQTGFDPTQINGGSGGNPDDYQRAMKACLEGRGYSVR